MNIDYYGRLPRLLQDELRDGRWLPIVGAGMSLNAVTPSQRRMPDWKLLGERVAEYLPPGYGEGGPVESISAFQELFGRRALIDRLSDELLVGVAQPSDVHRAFASIPVDSVITTNLDFLLEESWSELGRPVHPIVGEQRLTARRRGLATRLIKFHGDLQHPNEAVVTESDYDGFLAGYPTLATFVASLLIRRVPVLIGYSLDDPDFRAILHLLSQRLGQNAPTPWVILARSTPAETARYQRRGVRPVVLDSRAKVSHGEVFTHFFQQIATRLPLAAADRAEGAGDQVLSELRLRDPVSGSLVVFMASYANLGLYRTVLFPELRDRGLTPVTLDEIQSPSGLRLASLERMLRQATVTVADIRGSTWARSELNFLRSLDTVNTRLIVVTDRNADRFVDGSAVVFVERDGVLDETAMEEIVGRIAGFTSGRVDDRIESIRSRLGSGDVSFAFLEAVLTIEARLREVHQTERARFAQLVHFSEQNLEPGEAETLREAYRLRGDFLHKGVEPSRNQAVRLTESLLSILGRLS